MVCDLKFSCQVTSKRKLFFFFKKKNSFLFEVFLNSLPTQIHFKPLLFFFLPPPALLAALGNYSEGFLYFFSMWNCFAWDGAQLCALMPEHAHALSVQYNCCVKCHGWILALLMWSYNPRLVILTSLKKKKKNKFY